ncbi:fibronectin type III domain-containing protein [Crossiella sp. SN42]|uniref:fibronectin type III domain-containing protein n=1 Tax=Crossiella sp. SN42 TaxID=2944808 RepID=UPI00207D6251|nr:fibronectin type III domain-containing protein [Crossiella sp. SN42]MCO1582071.1 fibronectin type III domain-containing protein [Crossiella sp. SN42]
MKPRGIRRGRAPMALTALTVVGAVALALTGAAKPQGGADFQQSGHWVYNAVLGGVFHLDGATGAIDARAEVPEAEAGSPVVQGSTGGYVIGRSRIIEFGKSTLRVERSTPAPSAEPPVTLEVPGGPYVIYRESGKIVWLGGETATVSADGKLGDPVATADGTVWLHRPDNGAVCKLVKGALRLDCPANTPKGQTGALTVVADRPVFVNTATDTVHPIGEAGLGEGLPVGADLPPTVRLASTDVDGRIAVLDGAAKRMLLVDIGGPNRTGPPAKPAVVSLPPGDYTDVESSGQTVVVVNKATNAVLTFDRAGKPLRETTMPPGGTRVSRGEDARVYVDSADGGHVVTVDHDGRVTPVPISGDKITSSNQPQPPPVEPTLTGGPGPTTGAGPTTGPRIQPPPKLPPPPRSSTVRPVRPTSAKPPVAPASPPGAPTNVRASSGDRQLTVDWGAAAANGAPVSAYIVSWTSSAGGSTKRVGGGTRSTVLTGLVNGTAYTVTVVAENRAGRGPGGQATASPVAPKPQRSIQLSRGTPELYENDCTYLPHSARMRVTLRGFAPNTNVKVIPYSSNPRYSNEGRTVRTDANGTKTFEAFHYCQVGRQVWVVADGVKSNTINWVSQ